MITCYLNDLHLQIYKKKDIDSLMIALHKNVDHRFNFERYIFLVNNN